MTTDTRRAEFDAYCGQRGLHCYHDWSLPAATALLRHFWQQVPNAANGELVGRIADGWIAHTATPEHPDRLYTVVLAAVPASAGFAVRVLCHDRDLSQADTAPEADAEVLELDDHTVALESERFLRRYRLSTDHDQDQLRVWQLFSPALAEWLTDQAPADFSFELQDGALCCFVPGALTDSDALDRLCLAAAHVLDRVNELAVAAPTTAQAAPGSRDSIIDAELAKHPFDSPPKSVWAAARAFGSPLGGGRAGRLGAEAFFREYSAARGFRRIDESRFRASHFGVTLVGEVTQVSVGRLEGIDYDAFLVWTTDEDGTGWSSVVLDVGNEVNTFAFAGLPETEAAESKQINITGNPTAVIVFAADGSPRRRSAKRLDAFLGEAAKVLRATVAAGTFRR
ncbi:MAG: hypothetical protein ACJ75R_04015 [Solirubrobacterales bacterium]